MTRIKKTDRLKKELTVWDVFAISSGTLFTGFFLLPGLAIAKTGASAVFAFLAAAILILPAMLSAAELATAMPRSGGTYYFIDRGLGPRIGSIGGVGTYIALILKSSFALIGMGAYASLYIDLPIETVAISLTIFFAAINIVGAKETSGIQKVLVAVLISILFFFLLDGILVAFQNSNPIDVFFSKYKENSPFQLDNFLATVGLVFVSYVGLTKVVSVAEEINKPDRNIPLGMFLSWLSATLVNVIGVALLVILIDFELIKENLTPIATAVNIIFSWLPSPAGQILIIVSAIAAFISTANAGILASSRFILAMARDRLVWKKLATIGRFKTPYLAILLTALLMIFIIIFINVESIAKLSSSIQLLLFALLNIVVIVMRESRIESYMPGYHSPFYPYLQLLGSAAYLILIVMMGWASILFSAAVLTLVLIWYVKFVKKNVVRSGAIYHVFERLGRRRFAGLETELNEILKEKGLKEKDPYDSAITRAGCYDFQEKILLSELISQCSNFLGNKININSENLKTLILESVEMGLTPVEHGAAIFHARIKDLKNSEMVIVRANEGLQWDVPGKPENVEEIHAIFFLISSNDNPGLHLRLLGTLAERIQDENFLPSWMGAQNHHDLKATLLKLEKVLILSINENLKTAEFIGKQLMELNFHGCLVALLKRHDDNIVPHGKTVIREGDILTIIGEPDNLKVVTKLYQEKRGTKA